MTFLQEERIKAEIKMTRWAVLLLLIVIIAQLATLIAHGQVTEQFLDRTALIESRNNPHAVGKAGEKSAYQLKPIAVLEVNRVYGWTCSFREATTKHARAYARAYYHIISRRFQTTNENALRAHYKGMK